MAFAGCGSEKTAAKDLKVYSFSGGDDYITVSNGVIVLSDGNEAIYFGDLKADEENFSDITSFTQTFYVYKDGEKQTLSCNGVTDTSGGKVKVGGEMGKMWGEAAILGRVAPENLKNYLYFGLETTDKDGNVQNYQVQMKVVEVTEDTKA